MHYLSLYTATELRMFPCERMRTTPLSGLDPSMPICRLSKTEADWIDLRRRVAELFKDDKAIFLIADEPPSHSDTDDSLKSMPGPRRATFSTTRRTPLITLSTIVVDDQFSTLSLGERAERGRHRRRYRRFCHTEAGFSRAISSKSTDFDDEEQVDPMPIPSTQLEPAPPAFPPIAKTKSYISSKSREHKAKAASVHVRSHRVRLRARRRMGLSFSGILKLGKGRRGLRSFYRRRFVSTASNLSEVATTSVRKAARQAVLSTKVPVAHSSSSSLPR